MSKITHVLLTLVFYTRLLHHANCVGALASVSSEMPEAYISFAHMTSIVIMFLNSAIANNDPLYQSHTHSYNAADFVIGLLSTTHNFIFLVHTHVTNLGKIITALTLQQ